MNKVAIFVGLLFMAVGGAIISKLGVIIMVGAILPARIVYGGFFIVAGIIALFASFPRRQKTNSLGS